MKTTISILLKQAPQMKKAIYNCGYTVDYTTKTVGSLVYFEFEYLESHIAFEIGKELGLLL
jgi:hypothetical protein